MRSGPDQGRGLRFRGNRSPQSDRGTPQRSQTHDSAGSGDRQRGNASQKYQRYLTLAQGAARSDDRVASENYYQHAEHYFRVLNSSRDVNSAAASQPIGQATGETGLAPTRWNEIENSPAPAPEL